VKGIFWTVVTQDRSFDYVFATTPVAVPALPYHALAPVRPRRLTQLRLRSYPVHIQAGRRPSA